jgi:hypothetical protein
MKPNVGQFHWSFTCIKSQHRGKNKSKAQVNLMEKQLYYFKSRDHSINSTHKSLLIKAIIVLT